MSDQNCQLMRFPINDHNFNFPKWSYIFRFFSSPQRKIFFVSIIINQASSPSLKKNFCIIDAKVRVFQNLFFSFLMEQANVAVLNF